MGIFSFLKGANKMSENEKAYNEALDKAKEGNYASITDGDLEAVTGGYVRPSTYKIQCPKCGRSFEGPAQYNAHNCSN